MTVAVGIDVGGTKILAAAVDLHSGRLKRSLRVATATEDGGLAVLGQAATLARQVTDGEPATIGVGVCELVDRSGRITSAETIDWRDLDVEEALSPLGPVAVESDVRAAALAEARFGAGTNVDHFIYVTVGTGISYCLIVDGQPYRGANGEAIVVGAPPVEALASGRALAARAGAARAEDVFASSVNEDLIADAARTLGIAVGALVNALDPRLVIFGGGLGLRDDYRRRAAEAALAVIERAPEQRPMVVPAKTGIHAGVIGAALIGAERAPAALSSNAITRPDSAGGPGMSSGGTPSLE